MEVTRKIKIGNVTKEIGAKASNVLAEDGTSLLTHLDTNNPHGITKETIGLNNVDNTSDLEKPISNATQLALNNVQSTLTNYIDNSLSNALSHETITLSSLDNLFNDKANVLRIVYNKINGLLKSITVRIHPEMTVDEPLYCLLYYTNDSGFSGMGTSFAVSKEAINCKRYAGNDVTWTFEDVMPSFTFFAAFSTIAEWSATSQRNLRLATSTVSSLPSMLVGVYANGTKQWLVPTKITYVKLNFLDSVDTLQTLMGIVNALLTRYLDNKLNAELEAKLNEVDNKVDKITGKGLSTNDYTTEEKTKLNGIETNANKYVHPDTHPASIITGLSSVATSGSYDDLTNKPTLFSKSYNDLINKPDIKQSDWNQTDSSQIDYIKNKPTIPSITGLASELYVTQALTLAKTELNSVGLDGIVKFAKDPVTTYNKYGNYWGMLTTPIGLGIYEDCILKSIQFKYISGPCDNLNDTYIKIAKEESSILTYLYKSTNSMKFENTSTYLTELLLQKLTDYILKPNDRIWIFFYNSSDEVVSFRFGGGDSSVAYFASTNSANIITTLAYSIGFKPAVNVKYVPVLENTNTITSEDLPSSIIYYDKWYIIKNIGRLYYCFIDVLSSSNNTIIKGNGVRLEEPRFLWKLIPTTGGYYLYNYLGYYMPKISTNSTSLKYTNNVNEAGIYNIYTKSTSQQSKYLVEITNNYILDGNDYYPVGYGKYPDVNPKDTASDTHNSYGFYSVELSLDLLQNGKNIYDNLNLKTINLNNVCVSPS